MLTPRFEELDFQPTPLGDLILRKRTVLALDNQEIYEIILGNSFLMSSLFTVVEQELSRLSLKKTIESFPHKPLSVVVGGLGLGYTARAALEFPEVAHLQVIDYLEPVIAWHRRELVPLGKTLNHDPRCHFCHADFFASALDQGFPEMPPQVHAVLLDIDHSPAHLLTQNNARFYSPEGLAQFAQRLKPGGIFGLWSDDPPEDSFLAALDHVFDSVESHLIPFHNPIQEKDFESTVYLAQKKR